MELADFDGCMCGDYRHNHKNGAGPCCFNSHRNNGGLSHGFKKCMKFRFAAAADPKDQNYIRNCESKKASK